MKADELLYEMMQDINDKETIKLDIGLEHTQMKQKRTAKKQLKVQEKLTMNKIHREMKSKPLSEQQSEGKQVHVSIRFGRKKPVLLIAVVVMMFGMVAFAREKDWDIEMAEMLGLSGVMEELDGGYVKIGVSDTSDDVTVTASQLIGDKNTMWLQLDTNVPWTVEEGGYYMFGEDNSSDCYNRSNLPLTGGETLYSYNNNGYVSFMWQFEDHDNINRAKIVIRAKGLVEYQPVKNEEDEAVTTVISNGTWELEWENRYAPNTITRYPFRKVTCIKGDKELSCIIREVEVSPLSIQIRGWKSPFSDGKAEFSLLEAVKLKDGTVIPCNSSVWGESNFEVRGYLSLDYAPEIDMSEIEYVTIGGEDIRIAR